MSRTEPIITPAHYLDFLENVGDVPDSDPSDDRPSRIPVCRRWANHIAKTLGFSVIESYPNAWDESGCFILHRLDMGDMLENQARSFEYLALLMVSYENEIVIGIPNVAAYLQFYRLIQPLLTMQADSRFHADKDIDGRWEHGRNFQDFVQASGE